MARRENKQRKKISVIISGMPSVGKTTAANVIAKKFHLIHLGGGDMLKEIAIERGYKAGGPSWWDSSDGMKFMAERRTNLEIDKEVDKRLIKKISAGGVVVTSYPIPWICKNGLKLWFSASPKMRAARLAGRDSIPLREALDVIKKRDMQNRQLYHKLYSIDFGNDLSVFNYEVETENLTAKQVAAVSAKLVSSYLG